MSDYNRGDNYYNQYPDEYDFADEVGWTRRSDGEVVERHEGYGGRRQREADEDWAREERRQARRSW
jgi:hypothetical protein